MRVSDVEQIWSKCLNVHKALGARMRYLERDRPKSTARMGLVARMDLQIGDTISLETVDFSFPAKGIPTEHWSLVKGWKLKSEKDAGKVIGWDDLEPTEY